MVLYSTHRRDEWRGGLQRARDALVHGSKKPVKEMGVGVKAEAGDAVHGGQDDFGP